MAEPVGEDKWLAFVDEASRGASDLEQRVSVVQLYKRALAAEPWSTKLWLAYCEWVWSLHIDSQNGDAGWPEEEQLWGQELFSEETALDVWQEGAQSTQYRLNDSNELWDRWIAIELERLSKSINQDGIERMRKMFLNRLQIPHATFDQTSQMFSSFITQYDEASWEKTMVQTTQLSKHAKDIYSQREDHELKFQKATDAGDQEAQQAIMKEYLDWELQQLHKKPKKGSPKSPLILLVALYERALASTGFGLDASVWEDYIVFLASHAAVDGDVEDHRILSAAQRSTSHCPWSGSLWARYILIAETKNQSFSEVEQIKHSATSAGVLDRDGLEAVMEVYIAWCGYLKRRTILEGATDEDIDIADVGLPAAIESVNEWGKRLYGPKNYKGDPLFRMEQIYVQYCTQRGDVTQARTYWAKLSRTHCHSYEFWQQYYHWERTVRVPTDPSSLATAVLEQAVHQKGLDWPEKLMEVYLRHCQNHVDAQAMLRAKDTVYTQAKEVAKRRKLEADAAAAYAQQNSGVGGSATAESPSGVSKRKRETAEDEVLETANKKVKNDESTHEAEASQQQMLKRDRENTSILVTNLPAETTKLKLRQYFKSYGDINNVILNNEEVASSALIEFNSHKDVKSSLLRNGKDFDGRQIQVKVGTGLTIYVTNYPPTADEEYIRKLFSKCGEIFSIRFPSLKFNTQRRFCYISFKDASSAEEATKLDGKPIEGRFKLVAKYSDPSGKKAREGATAEGREVHVTGLDRSLTEDEIKEVFAKYGKIDRLNLLKSMSGYSKGAAFISFENKEAAKSALELHKTKLKSSILTVDIAATKNFKPTATTREPKNSVSPASTGEGESATSPAGHLNTHAFQEPSRSEIAGRTVTLMNIPDTVNDARVRAIAEPYGTIVKLVLRPDHQGAIIEYADLSAAGRASMGLEGHELVPGRKLRTGGLKDLFAEKGEVKTDRIQVGQGKKEPPKFIQPNAPVKRPGGRGGRGGLGAKRGFGYTGPPTIGPTKESTSNVNGENKAAKSNADFRAMLTGGK